MKWIILISLLSFQSLLYGQVGINFRYTNFSPTPWEEQTGINLFDHHFELGIDYWFRLKNYRLEFLPEIYGLFSKTDHNGDTYSQTGGGLAFNTNIYLFDFEGDCNCPTFSKQGNWFTKGFYLMVAPGVDYFYRVINEGAAGYHQIQIAGSLGAGLDIGIGNLVTISPYIRTKWLPGTKWDGFNSFHNNLPEDQTFLNSIFQFGVRMGFRPDYVIEQRRFRR